MMYYEGHKQKKILFGFVVLIIGLLLLLNIYNIYKFSYVSFFSWLVLLFGLLILLKGFMLKEDAPAKPAKKKRR